MLALKSALSFGVPEPVRELDDDVFLDDVSPYDDLDRLDLPHPRPPTDI